MLLHQLSVILFQLMALVTFYLLHDVNDMRRMRKGGTQKSKETVTEHWKIANMYYIFAVVKHPD